MPRTTKETPATVVITGAAGNIGYALLPLLASGYVFGPDRPIRLRLLDIPEAAGAMEGVRMELLDAAFPLLLNAADGGVVCTTDPKDAFEGADVIVLAGGYPRRRGMLRKDLIRANAPIFASMGRAIDAVASPDVRVLCVANPANTNCLIAIRQCRRIRPGNFCALTYLDHSRARARVAERLGRGVADVRNVIVWGNHSATQFPDAYTDAYLLDDERGKIPVRNALREAGGDDEWLRTEFVESVQQRGKKVIETRGASSAMSAAVATADCLRKWLVTGTAAGETISMAIYNDAGYYGVEKGLVFSFPCTCSGGRWCVKEGLCLDEFAREKIQLNEAELLEERIAASEVLDARFVSPVKSKL